MTTSRQPFELRRQIGLYAATAITVDNIFEVPRAMAGVLIAATGFPVYWLWKGRHARARA